jgi:hypothetical protein
MRYTMKSVSFSVSWLNPLSEIINEKAGVRGLESSQLYPAVFRCSWGQRWPDRDSTDGRFAGRFAPFVTPRARKFVRIDTTSANSRLVLEFHCIKHLRSQRLLGFSVLTDIKQRREALTHEQLAQPTTTKMESGRSFGARSRAEPAPETGGFRVSFA